MSEGNGNGAVDDETVLALLNAVSLTQDTVMQLEVNARLTTRELAEVKQRLAAIEAKLK